MTVLCSCWSPGAVAPEHVHPHEQIGICLRGQVVLEIGGKEHLVKSGELYHIPGGVPHAERNRGVEDAILTDFFSPVREDLARGRFEAEVVGTWTQQAEEWAHEGGEKAKFT